MCCGDRSPDLLLVTVPAISLLPDTQHNHADETQGHTCGIDGLESKLVLSFKDPTLKEICFNEQRATPLLL